MTQAEVAEAGTRAQTGEIEGLIRADDVLNERLTVDESARLDAEYGNADLMRAIDIMGIAGPFKVVSPWELEDAQGVRRIHAGGYSALPFGERYPPLVEFVRRYLAEGRSPGLSQHSLSPLRAALQHNLIRLLAAQAPSHADSQVFFSNSGAEAIEAAIKFAVAARPRAPHLVNFTGGYHGKTLGALALTPNPEYQDPFRSLLPTATTVPFGDAQALEDTVKRLGPDKVAAVILEPIQGERGVIVPPPGYLRAVGDLCRRHDILVIADEIQTGLGRTGHWFESLAQGLEPDIITLAKGLGGGLVPVGATITRRWITRRLLGGTACKRHSSTFGGNALAMAVGLKSVEILVGEDLPARSARLGQVGLRRLEALQRQFPRLLSAVRGAGMLFALDFQPTIGTLPFGTGMARMVHETTGILGLRMLHEAGVQANFSVNAARTLRLSPALNMPQPLFERMLERVEAAAQANESSGKMLRRTPASVLTRLASFGASG